MLAKLTNTPEENAFSAAPVSYMRREIQSNRERNIKKGHTSAFSKLFKSMQERYSKIMVFTGVVEAFVRAHRASNCHPVALDAFGCVPL